MTTNVYDLVTNAIIEQLDKVNPNDWNKPWFNIGASPMNAISKASYRGINSILLANKPYQSNLYASFKQWSSKQCSVKKGEKGHLVVFWKFTKQEDEQTGDIIKQSAFCKHYWVFNSEQVEGDFAREQEQHKPKLNTLENHLEAERWCSHYLANERIPLVNTDRAYYCLPSAGQGERISMPLKGQFKSLEAYYSTFFHEIGHSTGETNRLNRDLSGKFGNELYAKEELVAEFTAALLCAVLGLTQTPRQDHAQYIANWLQVLRKDKRFAVSAASQAQKAVDYVQASVENYAAFLNRKVAAV